MSSYRLTPAISDHVGDLVVGDPSGRGESWIWLGTLAESGARRLLKLDVTAEHVLAILGKRGTGKSYSLGVLLEGLGAAPVESALAQNRAARTTLVLDVLDIFWSSALQLEPANSPELQKQYRRMQQAHIDPVAVNVDVWVPSGYENPSIDLPQTQVLRIAPIDLSPDDWATLFDIDLVGEPRGMLLEELIRKTSTTGWVDANANHYAPVANYGFSELLSCLEQDNDLAQAYTDSTRRSIRQRLGAQAANPLFQGTPTLLTGLLRPGRVAVLMLGRVPDSYKRVIASILARQIFRERRDASFAQKRLDLDTRLTPAERANLEGVVNSSIPRTWLLVDEAQVIVPQGERTLSGETLVKFAKEGRNFGLSLGLTTQQPAAVDSRLMSQVETLLIHQLAARQDIQVALSGIKSPLPLSIKVDNSETAPEDLIRILEQGTALFSCANASNTMTRACIMKIRPRVTAHGGYEA
jgi:DNA helicase HerA-like ATPase